MAFKGITFAGQNVTPKNDGGLYASHFTDGILWGCMESISGDSLVIQSGEMFIGGRVVQVDGATTVDLSGHGLTTGYVRVIMNADMTQAEGSQWYTTYDTSASTTFPALTKEDINNTGNLYQVTLAIIQISGGNLTDIYQYANYSNLITRTLMRVGTETDFASIFSDSGYYGLVNYVSSIRKGGLTFPPAVGIDAILYGSGNDIYVRPMGQDNDSSRFTFYSNGDFRLNGKQLGGHPISVGTKQVNSISAGGNVVVNKITGLDKDRLYDVHGYFGGTPTVNGSVGTTNIFIDYALTGQTATSKVIDEIQANTNVPRYRTCSCFITNANEITLRVYSSGVYGWNNIVTLLEAVSVE